MSAGWSDVGAWDALWQMGRQGRQRQRGPRRRTLRGQPRHPGVSPRTAWWPAWASRTRWWSRPPTPCWWPQGQDPGCQADRRSPQGRQVAARPRPTARSTAPGAGTTPSTTVQRFQVKRIVVNPGASLEPADAPPPGRALDRGEGHCRGHQWRQGTSAEARTNPPTSRWATRTAWPTRVRVPLEIIEVQSGSYLGEDDIVRFEDNYGRG